MEELSTPLKKFSKSFDGLGIMPGLFSKCLKPDTEPLNLYAPRSIPLRWRYQAKVELDEMLDIDMIEPIDEPTEWCSGLTIVLKHNGKIKMWVDLTALKRAAYPFPKVTEMLAMFAKGRVFSKLEANAGFWRIKLDPESKDLLHCRAVSVLRECLLASLVHLSIFNGA